MGKLSGYKVKDRKSIITGFNITETEKQEVLRIMPVKYQLDNVRYLGIYICRTNELLLENNILPLIAYIEQKCKRWPMLKLSWLGRDKYGAFTKADLYIAKCNFRYIRMSIK